MRHKRILATVLCWALAGMLCACAQAPGEETTTAPTETARAVPETQAAEPSTFIRETTAPTEPAQLLHSGIREDGSFDAGTLFVGDSLTLGLVDRYLAEQELLGDARYMAIAGGAMTAFYHGPYLTSGNSACLYSPEYEGLLMCEAIGVDGERTTAVYFMMGTNYSPYADGNTYVQIIEAFLESCPHATIYMQTVPYSTSDLIDPAGANGYVEYAMDYFQEQGIQRVQMIDTQNAIGYNLTVDGIHLTEQGQKNWYEALVAYGKENAISQ